MSNYWEWYFIIICALWAFSFPAGGTELPATKRGYKWIRRYLAPALTVPLLILLGNIDWWRVVLACGLLSGAMHLGYGSKVGWARRALIACLMVIPSLFLGFSWLTAAFPVVFLGLYALSNWKPMAKSFTWVLVCSINGIVLGATLCAAAYNCWFCK